MPKPLDLDRCRAGMKHISIEGRPRTALIEEAIAAIQKYPDKALTTNYFGIKNYASFGDQREDHQYGFGPKHGSIVFRIGRTDDSRRNNGPIDVASAVYLLEAYRDFAGVPDPRDQTGRASYDPAHPLMYLCQAIRVYDDLRRKVASIASAFDAAVIDATEVPTNGH